MERCGFIVRSPGVVSFRLVSFCFVRASWGVEIANRPHRHRSSSQKSVMPAANAIVTIIHGFIFIPFARFRSSANQAGLRFRQFFSQRGASRIASDFVRIAD